MSDTTTTTTPSTRRVSRTRGAASGVLLVLLGAWAGLAPFIGPLFNFGFTPDKSWHWTAARGWYEVAPGAAIVVGGLLLLAGTSRVTTTTGAWLAILAGGWLICGPAASGELSLGSLGTPLGDNGGVRAFERLAFFYLLGAVVIFLAAAAFGRLSVVTVRDVRVAEQREAARLEAEQAAEREALEREAVEREVAQRRAAEREAYERQTAEREAAEREDARRTGSQQGEGAYAGQQTDRDGDQPYGDETSHPEGQQPYRDGEQPHRDERQPVTERTAGQSRPYADEPADDRPYPDDRPSEQRYGAPGQPYQGDAYGDQRQNWQAPPPPQR